MVPDYHSLCLALACGILSALGTWALLPLLRRHVLDTPNARSNHAAPTPRGGGIAMIAAALIGLFYAGAPPSVLAAALFLACISFIDDIYDLPAASRFVAQALAVALALASFHGRLFPVLPQPAETILIAVAWLWYINLTNFMDGIDGISAMEAIMVSAGIGLIHMLHPGSVTHARATQAAIIAACAYGFYLFNKHPAKLFMGDVGSVPLGFLMGYLLLSLAASGYLLSALILPAYYLADATWTFLKRLTRGEKVWQAHSQHAYQQAVRGGLSHAQVVARISWLNAVLIALALVAALSMMAGIASALAAYGLTFWLLNRFTHGAPG